MGECGRIGRFWSRAGEDVVLDFCFGIRAAIEDEVTANDGRRRGDVDHVTLWTDDGSQRNCSFFLKKKTKVKFLASCEFILLLGRTGWMNALAYEICSYIYCFDARNTRCESKTMVPTVRNIASHACDVIMCKVAVNNSIQASKNVLVQYHWVIVTEIMLCPDLRHLPFSSRQIQSYSAVV